MIVLTTLPFWGHFTPSLGPPLLKAYLTEQGYRSKLLDINVHAFVVRGEKYATKWDLSNGWELSDEAIIEYYNDNLPLFEHYRRQIVSMNPKVVGFTTYYTSLGVTKIFAALLKESLPDAKIIFGGPSVAKFMGNTRELLDSGYVDAVCIGEGEKALIYFVQEVESNHLTAGTPIPGIAYKKDGKVIEAPIEYIKRLDDLPFPDYSDYDLELYSNPSQIPSYVSRGCPNQCFYCTERNFFEGLRVRSAKRVMEEFEHIRRTLPKVNYVRFFDSISNAKTSMLEEFCDLKIASNNRLKFNLENAVIRKEMRLPLYTKLKKAGCTLLGYGLETSSQDLLKSVGKLLALGVDIPAVLTEGRQAGLYVSVNIMFGIPGETDVHFDKMVDFLTRNRESLSGINPAVNFCVFYPGSYVAQDPGKYSVDLSNGPNFWATVKGDNSYPIRMERFEKFLRIAKVLKLDNLIGTDTLPNKHALLFEYYLTINDRESALAVYSKIESGFLTPNLVRAHRALQGELVIEPEVRLEDFCRADRWPAQLTPGRMEWMVVNFNQNSSGIFIAGREKQAKPLLALLRKIASRTLRYPSNRKRRQAGQSLLNEIAGNT